jgi:transposase InsO family protein
MICIEHFSKVLVLEPLPSKEAKHTCYAFEHGVLGRFGACAEVVTDQGTEFQGEFAAMLSKCFIDHRTTSANHPQSNGAAERCVQTIKRSLRRYCEDTMTANTWDKQLPYISMGYNCSKQMSTNCSPYQLLYAREPSFPSCAMRRFTAPISLDPPDAATAAAEINARAEYLKVAVPTIANNLKIAQHRDQLRYAATRDGTYLPRLRKFNPGDYVYVRRSSTNSTLQIDARQIILRVVKAHDNGTVTLVGRCNTTTTLNQAELAPCHLPYIDGLVRPELATPSLHQGCEVCNFPDNERYMLCCDSCGTGWHTYCLDPRLEDIPEGVWVCPRCTAGGINPRALQQQGILPKPAKHKEKADILFPGKETRGRDLAAAALDGYRICIPAKGRRRVESWGTLRYRGAEFRPKYFTAMMDDGSTDLLSLTQVNKLRPQTLDGTPPAKKRRGRPRKAPAAAATPGSTPPRTL